MELIELGRHLGVYARLRLCPRERGSSIVEYVLLVALIAVVCLLALQYLGTTTSGRLSSVASQLAAA